MWERANDIATPELPLPPPTRVEDGSYGAIPFEFGDGVRRLPPPTRTAVRWVEEGTVVDEFVVLVHVVVVVVVVLFTAATVPPDEFLLSIVATLLCVLLLVVVLAEAVVAVGCVLLLVLAALLALVVLAFAVVTFRQEVIACAITPEPRPDPVVAIDSPIAPLS